MELCWSKTAPRAALLRHCAWGAVAWPPDLIWRMRASLPIEAAEACRHTGLAQAFYFATAPRVQPAFICGVARRAWIHAHLVPGTAESQAVCATAICVMNRPTHVPQNPLGLCIRTSRASTGAARSKVMVASCSSMSAVSVVSAICG